MAGRHYTPSSSTFKPRSPALLLLLSFLALTLVFYIFSIFSSSSPTHTYSISNPSIDYSFVTSLEKFLTKSPRSQSNGDDSVSETNSIAYAKKLDNLISKIENQRLYNDPFYDFSPLKVYVYEMPSKFTYDLLWLFHNTYKETSNLTSNGSPVHRLIEQHSIDYWLWADLIAPESERLLKNVIRVHKQEEADLFYIPFFTTISFFLLEKPQCKALYRDALKWVMDQPAWNRSGGRDHILPVHHPWSFKTVRKFMKKAIWLLPDMDSTGNWYKPGQVYLEKDLILPYVPNVDLCDAKCLSASKRTTLLFFRGRLKRNAGGKIRAKLVEDLRSSEGVLIEEGTAGQGGKAAAQSGMRKSIFCLNPAGDTPSSARLFDAIVSGCIPVIVSDELELPFEGILDYRKIALFVSSSDALQPGWLVSFLKSVGAAQIKEMQMNLAKYARHFLYSHPAQPLGPEDLVWRMVRHLLDFSWLSLFSHFLGAFIWFFQDTLVPKKGCSRSKVLILFWLDIAVLIKLFYVLVSISFTPFMSIAGCLLNIAFMSFDKGGISRKARECFMSYSCSYRLFCSGLASMQGKFYEQNPCTSTVITDCCDATMMI